MLPYRFVRHAFFLLLAAGALAGCAANPVTGTPDLVFQSEAGEIKRAQEVHGCCCSSSAASTMIRRCRPT